MADQPLDDNVITVRFSEPVEGVDPDDGDVFSASRHRVNGTALRQDRHETVFLNGEGEVVARWETRLVAQIAWPPTTLVAVDAPTQRAPSERLRLLRERYPQAYQRWDPEEDEQLTGEFHEGLTVPDMVRRHGRGRGGITSRLVHLKLVERGTPASEIGRPTTRHAVAV
jgi:hypothetical protein